LSKRPKDLRVLGREFTVVTGTEEAMPDCYGDLHPHTRVIRIRDDVKGFDEVDTVLHELMHGVRWCQGRQYQGEVEEDWVTTLATGLTHVLRDNPALLRWIAATLRKDTT
jgi:hypothetical protein